MDVKELRIGNWVHSNITHTDWQIEQQSIELVFHQIDKLSPIPLTEEWLLKFGFKEFDYGFYIDVPNEYGGHIVKYKNDDCKTQLRLEGCDYGQVGVDILYVHQLQNLYFALTGKELECQPEA